MSVHILCSSFRLLRGVFRLLFVRVRTWFPCLALAVVASVTMIMVVVVMIMMPLAPPASPIASNWPCAPIIAAAVAVAAI